MDDTDKRRFLELCKAQCELYGRSVLSTAAMGLYWNDLKGYPFEAVEEAMRRHRADPQHGSYFPKTGDVLRHLPTAANTHLSADEAWGICVRLADEADTVIVTAEMRAAWVASAPILEFGDEVGARMAFKAAYARQVERAAGPPKWEVSLGTDPELRGLRVEEAVQLARLPATRVEQLGLPAPTQGIAGLLTSATERLALAAPESPTAVDTATVIERLQAIKAGLEPGSDEAEAQRREALRVEFEARRAAELARVQERLGDGGTDRLDGAAGAAASDGEGQADAPGGGPASDTADDMGPYPRGSAETSGAFTGDAGSIRAA